MFLLFVAPICHSKASDIFFSSCIFFSYFQQERRPVVPSLPQMFSWPCRQFCAQFFKNYLTSATFFNVTIICSSNSRASAFFLIYDFFFHFQQGQLPAAPTLPPIFGGRVANFFLSANFCPVFSKSIFTPVIRLVVMLLFLIIGASLFIWQPRFPWQPITSTFASII